MVKLWTEPEQDPRSFGDPVGEKATYAEYLDNYRLTLRMKCDGLDAEQLARRSVPPSTLSLLGLVRHMAGKEDYWFSRVFQDDPQTPRLYKTEADPDGPFTGAVADPEVVREAFATWQDRITLAEQWLTELPESDLGNEMPDGQGGVIAVRDMLVLHIQEYARHTGHADLLRECIDGRTGM